MEFFHFLMLEKKLQFCVPDIEVPTWRRRNSIHMPVADLRHSRHGKSWCKGPDQFKCILDPHEPRVFIKNLFIYQRQTTE